MEVLTIQPLTEVLSRLKNKGMLIASKLRIIINKYVEVNGITEKEIIGGMSFYNDPTMAYMKELFDRNSVRYMIIPFEKEIYEKYLSDGSASGGVPPNYGNLPQKGQCARPSHHLHAGSGGAGLYPEFCTGGGR